MNIKSESQIQKVSLILKEISSPARIRILLAIGTNEACVCHLEATLGMRQAYLSQHLMALRQAGILVTNRDGRFINYRLANIQVLDVIKAASDSINIDIENEIEISAKEVCPCPKCQHYSEAIITS